MEARNGFVEQMDVKICQLGLKLTEGSSRVAEDSRIFDGVVGDGVQIIGHSPEIFPVDHIGLSVPGVMKVQAGSVGAFPADMLGHPVNVFHQLHRLPECVGVDILHQK